MVSLRECNTLMMDGTSYPLKFQKNSREMTFQGSGGPDELDHRKIKLSLFNQPSESGDYTGTFEIQYPQNQPATRLSDQGALRARPNKEGFSLFPIDVYQDRREWTLIKV